MSQHDFVLGSDLLTPDAAPLALSPAQGLCRPLWLWGLLQEGSPWAVLTASEQEASRVVEELVLFSRLLGHDAASLDGQLLRIPGVEGSPYADLAADPRQIAARLGALGRLIEGGHRMWVGSVDAWRKKVLPAQVFASLTQRYTRGQSCERDAVAQRLAAAGYLKVDLVQDPGSYAVRGGVIDLFSPAHRDPVRLEWWGDELESVKSFDPNTQRSLRSMQELLVYPARESVVSDAAALRERLFALADRLETPSSQSRRALDNLLAHEAFFGMEALVPLCHGEYVDLGGFLPQMCRWVVLDPPAILDTLESLHTRDEDAFAKRIEQRDLVCDPAQFFVSHEDLRARVDQGGIVVDKLSSSARVGPLVHENTAMRTQLAARRGQSRDDWFDPLIQALADRAQSGWDILLVVSTQSQLERLHALIVDSSVAPLLTMLDDHAAPLGHWPQGASRLRIVVGRLAQGFELPSAKIWVLCEFDLFGQQARKTKTSAARAAGASLASLKAKDFVVHMTHGVGQYQGLVRLDLGGVDAEFVLIEYAKQDRLYLPVHRIGEMERYHCVDGQEPRLDKLGGQSFAVKTKKVRADARMLAEELLTLYAQREALVGFAFPPPGAAMADFAASFPYEATPDQAQAIKDVLSDLCAAKPMDRLICGDVGFGKTEVALRACFHVAHHQKQVAVLAPTTILAQQHLQTFRRRMKDFAIEVVALHRYVPAKTRAQILDKIRAGAVDIVVGTHALLSSEVQFGNLGLVVIDEEQRFGVRQKERFKRLKTKVDMLTLSATPIPRTLHMGLMGMREISMIMTPPGDRLSVHTKLARDSDEVVQAAIAKELARGGQVFVVVPRIEGIMAQARRISALAPNARVAVAHGNMAAQELEKVMLDFVEHRQDILLCTTIVESGLDIPSANTIIIMRADQFGMAQLYQLRGRVGRSNLRAHCFLLVNSLERLSKLARHRLDAIVRHSELGSGYLVASQDLELRGAGDLLGRRQSGSIAKVGFQAYARALEEAVAETRGQELLREEDPELNIDIPAFLPADDIEDTGQRIELYRRLGAAPDAQALRELLAEIHDRYGRLAPEAQHYGLLMIVKLQARKLGICAVEIQGTRLGLVLGSRILDKREGLIAWVQAHPKALKWSSTHKISAKLPERSGPDCAAQLEAAGQWLSSMRAHLQLDR